MARWDKSDKKITTPSCCDFLKAEISRKSARRWARAKTRVNRALEKLRKFFANRGVSSTTAILAGAISANSVQAAPAMLAKSMTAVAIAKGAAASGSTLTLIKGALKLMAWTKVKMAIVVSVGLLLTAGTTITIKEIQEHKHESQQQHAVIMIATNGSIRVATASQLSQLKGQATFSIGFKIGSGRDAIVRQLEQIHATILKDSPELLRAEFEKTPKMTKPMQVELSFIGGKLTRVNYILPRADISEFPLVQPPVFPVGTNDL
jgi:hypothetical protein